MCSRPLEEFCFSDKNYCADIYKSKKSLSIFISLKKNFLCKIAAMFTPPNHALQPPQEC